MQHIYYLAYITYLLIINFLIFFDRKKPTQKFSWILLLVFLPVVGLLLYLFLGSDSFLEYRKEKTRKRRGDVLTTLEHVVKKRVPKEAKNDLSKAQLFHQKYGDSHCTTDNNVEIFTNGAAKYRRLFQELRAAKDHIHVEYFTIHNDRVGKELIDILVEKAEQNVEVKLLYDSVGCLATGAYPLFSKLRKAGGKISTIRPHALDINYRNHRKIVVIDGKIGYAGGMNMGEKYKYGVGNKPWRDTHLRLTGSAVYYLQQVFIFDWLTTTRGPNTGLRHMISHYFPEPDDQGNLEVQVVANGLYDKYKSDDLILLSYFNIISRATKRVWIQTPYFAPSDVVLQTLRTLASLGVDVRIMTSASYVFGDFFHRSITNYFLRYLIDSGVKVFKYDGIMHAKTMLVDDSLCIGSVNLNARSLARDDEVYIYSESRQLIDYYEEVFSTDLKHCVELDYAKFRHQHLAARAMESVMSFFSPLS